MGYIQDATYTHLCDIYRPDFDIPPGGDPMKGPYTLAQSGVPCRFVTKSAVDQPDLVGLIESDDLLTVDTVRLPENTEIETSWILVNRTLRQDGTESLNYGRAYILRGDPKRRDSEPGWEDMGRVVAFVSRLAAKPSGVS